MHVTAPVTVGTATALVTATDPLGPNDAGRLFYDTTEAIAGGIGWQVWNGDALVTDYTYVTQATLLSGEDQANDVLKVERQSLYTVAAFAATPVVVSSTVGSRLKGLVCTVASSGGVIVYDNTAGSGVLLYSVASLTLGQIVTFPADIVCTVGLTVAIAGSGTVNVLYSL